MARRRLFMLGIGALVIGALLLTLLARTGSGARFRPTPPLRTEESMAANAVWQVNLKRQEAVVYPSRAYAGLWLRDSFWVFLGLGDVTLAQRALGHFSGRQLSTGQVPTQFTVFLHHPLYRSDESTLLFLIWADWLARHHRSPTNRTRLSLALGYVRHQARAGSYLSQPGSYADWFDAYRLPRADVLSYNQGLYVVALLAARDLGLGVADREVRAALDGYRALTAGPDGYLRFSRGLNYHDISGLTGDFLALWLFHDPLLSNAAVDATLRSQPRFGNGYKVVSDGHGQPLPPAAFVTPLLPGDYQNGGSWLLFDYLALADGRLRGLPTMTPRMAGRLRDEFQHGVVFHEYLNTNPQSPLFQHEPAYRDGFSWDTFVLRIDAILAQGPG